ncbi:MAG: polysaccharide deacetylase family protein [Clostridia bacterium]|nr:polysaccharide deacetylase family protein [Clostridia bacterium]
MESRDKKRWIIIIGIVLLTVATIVVFTVAGSKGTKSTKVKTSQTTASTTAKPTTTKPTTTQPTTVDANGSTDSVKKMIALCFDDGPGTDSTKKLVEGLKKRGAKATFFELGQMIEENPDMCKLVSKNGCEIGIHGWAHSDFTTLGASGTEKEIDDTAALIKKYTGKTPTHVRPPYGSYNDEIQELLKNKGYDMIMWNVDTLDWKTRDAEAVRSAIVSNGADGGDILCLHDIYDTTAEGVLQAVDELTKQGYKFVTISELEAARDKFVAGRIWLSAHEYYDFGSKENVAKASLTQASTAAGGAAGGSTSAGAAQGGTTAAGAAQGGKQDATDVEITWPDDAKQ